MLVNLGQRQRSGMGRFPDIVKRKSRTKITRHAGIKGQNGNGAKEYGYSPCSWVLLKARLEAHSRESQGKSCRQKGKGKHEKNNGNYDHWEKGEKKEILGRLRKTKKPGKTMMMTWKRVSYSQKRPGGSKGHRARPRITPGRWDI